MAKKSLLRGTVKEYDKKLKESKTTYLYGRPLAEMSKDDLRVACVVVAGLFHRAKEDHARDIDMLL